MISLKKGHHLYKKQVPTDSSFDCTMLSHYRVTINQLKKYCKSRVHNVLHEDKFSELLIYQGFFGYLWRYNLMALIMVFHAVKLKAILMFTHVFIFNLTNKLTFSCRD